MLTYSFVFRMHKIVFVVLIDSKLVMQSYVGKAVSVFADFHDHLVLPISVKHHLFDTQLKQLIFFFFKFFFRFLSLLLSILACITLQRENFASDLCNKLLETLNIIASHVSLLIHRFHHQSVRRIFKITTYRKIFFHNTLEELHIQHFLVFEIEELLARS